MKTEEITQIQDEIGKICWVYIVDRSDVENGNISVFAEQDKINEVCTYGDNVMYRTSNGLFHKTNIAFTEIDAYRKAKEHFETVQRNMAVLIAQAEAKIKELENKTK